MKDKVAFHNFKDEQELEAWISNTINAYSKEQIASLTGYEDIINAVNNAIYDMKTSSYYLVLIVIFRFDYQLHLDKFEQETK